MKKQHRLDKTEKDGVVRVTCECGRFNRTALAGIARDVDGLEHAAYEHRFPLGVTFADELEPTNQTERAIQNV
jgi:hypothetical protein